MRRNSLPLTLLFIAVVLVIIATGFVTSENLRLMRHDDLDVRRSLAAEREMRELFAAVQEAESGQRGFLLTGDAAYLETFNRSSGSIDTRFNTVRVSFSDSPDQLERLRQLQLVCHDKITELRTGIALRQAGQADAAVAVIQNGPDKTLMDRIRQENIEIANVQAQRLGQIRAESVRAYSNGLLGAYVSGGLGLSLMFFTALLSLRERRTRTLSERRILTERERFRTTLSSIGDGVIVVRRDGRIDFINLVARKLLGFADDALGKPVGDVFRVIDETTRAPIEQPVTQVLRDGMRPAASHHTLLVNKDGNELPIEDSVAPIRDSEGRLDGAVLVFRDASEKRRLVQALEQSESEYRSLFDEAGVGNANVGTKSRCLTRVNRRLALMTGFDPSALMGTPFIDLFDDEVRQAMDAMMSDLLDERVSLAAREARIKRADGSRLDVRVSANLVRGGETMGSLVLVMFEDISETRHALAALRENEMHLRLILENVIAFVLLLAPDGTVMQINGEARAIGGRASLHLVGRKLQDSFLFSYDAALAAAVQDVISEAAAGKTVRTDLRARVAQGVYITIDASVAPVYDNDDRLEFLVASGIDISQRKAVEEELQRSDRRKDEFLAMLGHELRNPLAPIATSVALSSLVNDLLDVARFTNGKISLRMANLDVADPLHRAIEINDGMFRARRQNFTVDIEPAPMLVHGDLHRLTQIFGNLLNNASKYSEAGASITLSAHRIESEIKITVSDTGMGIGASVLPHVFELFTQSERALDRAQGGLGIGLTLVKRLVELHHGSVEAESAGIGSGSCFTVRLPCARTVLADVNLENQNSSAARTLTILVVDDNHDAAETLCELLRLFGHRATAAYDGPSALGVAAQLAPEVVMLDIGLPGLNGHDVAAKLRHLPETRSAYLVAVTGYGQSNDRERALAAGFDAHFVKPIDVDALAAMLAARSQSAEVPPEATLKET